MTLPFRALPFRFATWKAKRRYVNNLVKDNAEIATEVAEKASWDQANGQQKLGLVWRNEKKISQIINDYICLPFFLFLILCLLGTAGFLPTQLTYLPVLLADPQPW